MIIFEDCLKFSIADFKRLGYFVPDGVISGVLRWNNTTAKISISVDNINRVVSLDYIVDGERNMSYNVYIYEQEANIGKGVVRYFDCPITHNLCRKLYFNGSMFVSRKAMRGAMYRCQAMSKWQRTMGSGWASDEFIPFKPYGKTHYRGKLTPYGKRIERYQNHVEKCETIATDWLFNKFGKLRRDK